jgi:hypothetical protein
MHAHMHAQRHKKKTEKMKNRKEDTFTRAPSTTCKHMIKPGEQRRVEHKHTPPKCTASYLSSSNPSKYNRSRYFFSTLRFRFKLQYSEHCLFLRRASARERSMVRKTMIESSSNP